MNWINEIEKNIAGIVIKNDNPEFSHEKNIWNLAFDPNPLVVIKCKTQDDVVKTFNILKENKIKFVVRSGKHNIPGFNNGDKKAVIDLTLMNKMEVIDEKNKLVKIEAGAIWKDIASFLKPYNIAITSGNSGFVGIGGLAQGSGFGYFLRDKGLAIDLIKSVKILLANGKVVTASEKENIDLFFGVRGSGGAFGIVLEFIMQAHDGYMTYIGDLYFKGDNPKLWSQVCDLGLSAPNEITINMQTKKCPATPMFKQEDWGTRIYDMHFNCPNKELAEQWIKKFEALGVVIANDVKWAEYPSWFPKDETVFGNEAFGLYTNKMDEKTSSLLISKIAEYNLPNFTIQTRVLGGNYSKLNVDTAAFSHRDKNYMTYLQAQYKPEQKEEYISKIRAAWEDIKVLDEGAELHFVNSFLEKETRYSEVFSKEKLNKLKDIKKKFDPENLFSGNINIFK